ncbi:MAG TPA: N-acetylmuramoyl-L-alanine amidase [Thermoanaerobaculia bacterium]|nr:N-acetylmuramoyl-L-alanine amidase [Thermoanaerobaculia bacterium]
MRSGWVWLFLILQAASILSAAPATQAPIATARISSNLRAELTREYEIAVTVKPHEGDAWSRLARRVSGDAANWEDIAAFNDADENLQTEQLVRVPFTMLKAPLQRDIISTLFPKDQATDGGWKHVVVGSRGIEGESLWKIAEWFTGDGANYSLIRTANPGQGLSTRKGDVILVPKRLLSAAFGGSPEEENAPKTAAEVRKSSDDATQRAAADEELSEAVLAAAPQSALLTPPSLTYVRGTSEPHAIYRLQPGEALYSSVAIRFTGRVYSKDVGDVLDRIIKFNGIDDVARIPSGQPIRIPMDLLLPEYLPHDDPTRMAREETRRESAKAAKRTRASGLTGVQVVLDAGHGGNDPGTEHDGVWESTYVYDVACRLKKLLEKDSAAKVSMTTKSKKRGYGIPERNVLDVATDHYVQTTPRFVLDDAIVGVNLRWYLANSMFRRAMKSGTPREKVVFISIHADSLHPSLRGAMAYVPGASFVTGTFRKEGDIYLTREEVREQPEVTQSRRDALEAEGLSRELAESIMGAFGNKGLKVHPFEPVRDNVIRNGHEWVPAIIKHNQVPTRMLIEVGNLGNAKDRELIQTKKHRQQLAEAIYAGLVDFYSTRGSSEKPAVVASAKSGGAK